ncbi:MAG: arginase family protein [Chloroflexia bacterium]|nr:arginase family protein [Chloroflexia bacterium]MDQ3411757.1 arginase family protein [Chloroflexota bacterium]
METATLPGLHVVPIRYNGHEPAAAGGDPVDTYAASGAYDLLGETTVLEPRFPEDQRTEEPTFNLGLLGGEIADAVAAGRRAGKPVLVVGGNCASVPGVIGGLQQAHGAAARIGLVWFDAHGDFNTPRTTLTGMLGGMPVAVAAGLAYPHWRELSRQPAPLPTDRIVMVDVRNLDEPEEQLIRATDVVIASPGPGFPGADLEQSVADLAARCDLLYLHIDSDILDERYVPNHRTKEPDGPTMEQVVTAIETVMATGKVVTFAIVSVWADGDGGDVAVGSGVELLRNGLDSWRRHGSAN